MYSKITRGTHIEALNRNINKQITFINFLGEEQTGYIKGAHLQQNKFIYEVSKTKNPRSTFISGKGSWSAVSPLQIIL